MKELIGKDYIPGNVIQAENGQLKVNYPLEFDSEAYFQRIDVISKKSALGSVVNEWL